MFTPLSLHNHHSHPSTLLETHPHHQPEASVAARRQVCGRRRGQLICRSDPHTPRSHCGVVRSDEVTRRKGLNICHCNRPLPCGRADDLYFLRDLWLRTSLDRTHYSYSRRAKRPLLPHLLLLLAPLEVHQRQGLQIVQRFVFRHISLALFGLHQRHCSIWGQTWQWENMPNTTFMQHLTQDTCSEGV